MERINHQSEERPQNTDLLDYIWILGALLPESQAVVFIMPQLGTHHACAYILPH